MTNEEFLQSLPIPIALVQIWGLGLPIWEVPGLEPRGQWTIAQIENLTNEGIDLLRSTPCDVLELLSTSQVLWILFHETRYPGRECTEEMVLHRLYAVLFQLVMNVRDAGKRIWNTYTADDDAVLVTEIVIYDDPKNSAKK